MIKEMVVLDNSMYVSVKPVMDSIALITRAILRANPVGIILTDPRRLHCTLMYSPKHGLQPQAAQVMVEPAKVFQATVKGYDIFGDEEPVLVLTLDSEDLMARHASWLAAGLKHTFDPFVPHITIGKPSDLEGVTDDFAKRVVDRLEGMELYFSRETCEPIVERV